MPLDNHPELSARQLSLSVGDIVACRFPPTCGIAKAVGPALVVEIATIAGTKVATLARGVPARGRQGQNEIALVSSQDLVAAGLAAPTRFLLGTRFTVSLPSVTLVAPPGTGSPVVGRLPSHLSLALEEARARMWGPAMADDRRRSPRRRPRVRGEDFEVVERRRRRRCRSETPRLRAQRAAR